MDDPQQILVCWLLCIIEPGIGHLKREHRLDRCRLKETEGDQLNAILSAAGMNFGELLKAAALCPVFVCPLWLRKLLTDRLDQIAVVA